MGRPLKHATSKPKRSMRQGNIAARVAKGNLGPTSVTGYYNALSPTESGKYIVYKMLGASQAPLSFTPQNDGEFIRLANQEGAGVSNITDALEYFAVKTNFTVAAIINTTGSIDVNPFCIYDSLGNNPSTQNKWFNSVAPLDNMSIDNKEHALNEFIAMRSKTGVRWGAPYAGTIIYEIDTSGNVSTKVSATEAPSSDDFNVTQGYRYVGNKPIHIHSGANGDVMCPVSYYGTEWGWYYSRYTPQTVRFYCFVDGTKIRLYANLTNSQTLTNDNIVTTLEGDEGDVVEYQIPTDPNYTGKYFQIHSNAPIVMTGRGSAGDMSIGALAGRRVYRRYNEYERTTNNTVPNDTSTYTVSDTTDKVWALSIADGSGGDNEVSQPLDELSKNYTYGHLLRSYFVLSPYADNIITISSWNGSSWIEFSSHELNGTITNPVAAASGSQSGGDPAFNTNTLWKFEGDNPFYIVINDNSRDEEALLGWNTGEVDAFFM